MEFNNCLRHGVLRHFTQSLHFNSEVVLPSKVTALHSLSFALLLRTHTVLGSVIRLSLNTDTEPKRAVNLVHLHSI